MVIPESPLPSPTTKSLASESKLEGLEVPIPTDQDGISTSPVDFIFIKVVVLDKSPGDLN